eukprot:CAMPEP_0196805926 /NCGR_PEP_ID=MMETSP1362-20130617/5780_1 /TAXON_ID=163516 /ORGANISM="Leptocylindrus danicus, Strain CCMP1856" /LENGTH=298 /DNA_ID=CAMNT_0042179137 /DNA_START=55 /DNA_END=951 /DNA_ORIENTATION=-
MANDGIANSSPPGNCKMAVPKKGRLYEKCLAMLKGAGIEFRREARLDVAVCKGIPLTLVFLPASDIATYVGDGNVDLGITGYDVVKESESVVERVLDLGFGKCKLCVQAPVRDGITDPAVLAGGRIVTSFPSLTKQFFAKYDEEKGVTTKVKFVSGSVEAACGLGLADAVVDLVETGTTMRAAGLEVVADVLETESILIANPNSEHKDLVTLIEKRIEGYIVATKHVMITYNVSNELLESAMKITPGKRSPTVTNLVDGNFKSVSSLVKKGEVVTKMDELSELGATDILVFDIGNSRF